MRDNVMESLRETVFSMEEHGLMSTTSKLESCRTALACLRLRHTKTAKRYFKENMAHKSAPIFTSTTLQLPLLKRRLLCI